MTKKSIPIHIGAPLLQFFMSCLLIRMCINIDIIKYIAIPSATACKMYFIIMYTNKYILRLPHIIGAIDVKHICILFSTQGPLGLNFTFPSVPVFLSGLNNSTLVTFAHVHTANKVCDNSWCIVPINVNLSNINIVVFTPTILHNNLDNLLIIKSIMYPNTGKIDMIKIVLINAIFILFSIIYLCLPPLITSA